MAHSMVYGISGDSYSDLGALIRAGIIDYHFLIHGGGNTPPAQFPKDCRAAGGSPILNNGNDGIAGWNGSASYYQNVKNLGYMAAGGESEQAPEIDSIMDNLIFMDYGGAGTGGGTNDNVWYVTHPGPVHGHGAASYLETYGFVSDFWGWDVLGQGAINAKSHGVKEIGILVGNWMISHSTARDYINLANAYEAHGITCAGIVVWGGYGTNMNSLYNQFASWFKEWQAIWPANMKTMNERYEGIIPAAQGTGPATCAIGNKVYVFVQGIDNSLWSRCNTAGTWSAWESLGGGLTSSPAAAVTADGAVHVFVRGTDKALWHRVFTTSWSKWDSLGGQIF